MKSLLILGRQPHLGITELESLYGATGMRIISDDAVVLDREPESIDFNRLGGSVKLSKILTVLDTTDWRKIEDYLGTMIPEHLQYVPAGKFKLGLSTFGLSVRTDVINATGLRLKKLIKASGRSVRIIPNNSTELNSAQVLHNQLTSATGWELVCVRDDTQTIIALTTNEQDINAYSRRDQNRPKRDAKVGMLPPKLAQLIINLTNPAQDSRVLDPFCGTGVILQEAALMGLPYYGSDLDTRMVAYSTENLSWLETTHNTKHNLGVIEQGDATSHSWTAPIGVVACETFLGKPLTSLPPRHVLDKVRAECDDIHEKFLRNLAPQLAPKTRLCLAVPAWILQQQSSYKKPQFYHLKTLDLLDKLGYTRMSFQFAGPDQLIYYRPDQIVARELVVLEKK